MSKRPERIKKGVVEKISAPTVAIAKMASVASPTAIKVAVGFTDFLTKYLPNYNQMQLDEFRKALMAHAKEIEDTAGRTSSSVRINDEMLTC